MISRIVTLTTDFSLRGPYVAAMKGVILDRAPGTVLVDATHEIDPQDVAGGAFVLAGFVPYYPPGTIHLAVVDPGVGTDRRAVAAEVDGQWLVLPDNGLITGVLGDREPDRAFVISNPSIRLEMVSSTFHGRDVFAPAAAFLALGGEPAALGPAVDRLVRLPRIGPAEEKGRLVGSVVFVDYFGNLITDLEGERLGGTGWRIEIAGRAIDGVSRTYGEHPSGSLIALIGSLGRLEVAIVDGDASEALGVGRGAPVAVRRVGKESEG